METKTIVLTKYLESDFLLYYSLVKEDKVMRYISGCGLTIEQARKKFKSIMEVNALHTKIGYFKVYNSTSEFIGDCKIERNTRDKTKLEIGFIFKENFWGKGYGTMICAKLLTLANEELPTVDIIGIVDPKNAASKNLLEKFGFQSYFVGVEDDLPTEKLILKKAN